MKITRWFLFIVYCSLFIALAGCAGQSAEIKPPEIVYNEDVCEACGMLISEARFACATVEVNGTPHKFDDIGDLVMYYASHSVAQVKAYFVHDYASQQWIRAETAYFIVSPTIMTPMMHGVAAFADKSAAEAMAQQYGVKVLDFAQLKAAKP
jgi:copper chaperone NosL